MANNIHIFDIDGVLADSWQAVLNAVKQEIDLDFAYEQIDQVLWVYNLVKTVTGDEHIARWADNLWFDDSVLFLAPLAAGVKERLQTLIDRGDVCFSCTSRPSRNRNVTLEWFEANLPFFPRENVFIRSETEENLITGDEFKQQKAIEVLATHQYDDSVTPLELTRSMAPYPMRSYLINRPWNTQDIVESNILRIDSVHTLID